ncbi:hypothetical protein Rt10032_c04g1804 [Rhodotorula toruloides]|uniref:Uncharacterized protein n=1 Tax=Rhodotorula toruloides TaxID=5286 RepID=A0A511KBP1_RHOTO|nr:hypothetical protein Rt10032_c04g1804 [Rhodotorula toruloides]
MSNTGTGTGTHGNQSAVPDPNRKFEMDASSKYAEWEQRGQGTLGQNPHESMSKPSALDKGLGKVNEGVGKVLGDAELKAQGLREQGKANEVDIQDLQTESGGGASYANRVPNN